MSHNSNNVIVYKAVLIFMLGIFFMLPAFSDDLNDQEKNVAQNFEKKCENLQGKQLNVAGADSTVVLEATVSFDDPVQSDQQIKHCKVLAETRTINPNNVLDSSTIKSLIRLPEQWNRRLVQMGNGGYAGNFNDSDASVQIGAPISGSLLQRGFITLINDTGHAGTSPFDIEWALDTPPLPGFNNQQEVNFARNSSHLSLLTTKQVLKKLYTKKIKHAYFSGCSTGGRQALQQATLFPNDYDGIIAGAPVAPNYPDFVTRDHLNLKKWLPFFLFRGGQLTPEKMAQVTLTVLDKCDLNDGVADHILTDPRQCNFDPHSDLPSCPDNVNGSTCFTIEEQDYISEIYQGTVLNNPLTTLHGVMPSSENPNPNDFSVLEGWPVWLTGTPIFNGVPLIFIINIGVDGYVVFDDPSFDIVAYVLSTSIDDIRSSLSALSLNSIPTTDLNQFKAKGGKLIMFHGWIDPGVPPENTIDYFNQISLQTNGNTDDFARLFMIPGMGHCGGGPGAEYFDGITAIIDWVENGQKPDELFAVSDSTRYPAISRPLCKYPSKAVYIGGDTSSSSSFECRTAAP